MLSSITKVAIATFALMSVTVDATYHSGKVHCSKWYCFHKGLVRDYSESYCDYNNNRVNCTNCCKEKNTSTQCEKQCPRYCRSGYQRTDDRRCNSDEDCSNCCEKKECEKKCPVTCRYGYQRTEDKRCNSDEDCSNCCEKKICEKKCPRTCRSGYQRTDDNRCNSDEDCSNCCEKKQCEKRCPRTCRRGYERTDDKRCNSDRDCSNCCEKKVCEKRCPRTCQRGYQRTDDKTCNSDRDCSNCCEKKVCDKKCPATCSPGFVRTSDRTCESDSDCTNCCEQSICPDTCSPGFSRTDDAKCEDDECSNCCEQNICPETCSPGFSRTDDAKCEDDKCSNCCEQNICPDTCSPGFSRTDDAKCEDDECSNCCEQNICPETCSPGFSRTDDAKCEDDECSNCCEQNICPDTCSPGFSRTDDAKCEDDKCSNCCEQNICPDTCSPGFSRTDDVKCEDDECSNCCEQNYCPETCSPGFSRTDDDKCEDDECSNCCEQNICPDTCSPGFSRTDDAKCDDDKCSNCCEQDICPETCSPGYSRTDDSKCDDDKCSNCCELDSCPDEAVGAKSSENGDSKGELGNYGIILNKVFNECEEVTTQKLGFDFKNVILAIQGTGLSISGLTKARTTDQTDFGFFHINVLIPGDFKLVDGNYIAGESFVNMEYIGALTQVDEAGDAITNPMVIELQTKAASEGSYSFQCLASDSDPNCNGWLMHRVSKTGSLVPEECKSCEYENHEYSDFRFIQNQECKTNPNPEPEIERCCDPAVGAESSKNGDSNGELGNYGIILNKVFDECENVNTQKLGFDFQNVILAIQETGLSISGLTKARTTIPDGADQVDFGFFNINVLIPGDFKLLDDYYIVGESLTNMEYIGALTQVDANGKAITNPMIIELQTKAASQGSFSFQCLASDSDPNCNGWLMHRVSETGSLVPEECKSCDYENHEYSDFRFIQNQECKANPKPIEESERSCELN